MTMPFVFNLQAFAALLVTTTLAGCAPPKTAAESPVGTSVPSSSSEAPNSASPNGASQVPAASTAKAAPTQDAATPPAASMPPATAVTATKPADPPPITSVRVYLTNECSKVVDYCVEDGSTLNTSLGSNSSTTHSVRPGAKFRLRKSSSCGDTVYVAPAATGEQKATLCKK